MSTTSNSTSSNNDDVSAPAHTPSPPPHVAVLGCGPGGMFFCHAIELKRRVLQERLLLLKLKKENGGGGVAAAVENNKTTTTKGPTLTAEEEADPAAALLRLPTVTVFEKSDGPGGVWRAQRTFAENNNNNATVDDVVKNTMSSSSNAVHGGKDNDKQKDDDAIVVVVNGNNDVVKATKKTILEDAENHEVETSHTAPISSTFSSTTSRDMSSPNDESSSPNIHMDQKDCSSVPVSATVSATVVVTKQNTVQVAASAEMYEALWCNGPKEAIEFFD
jgi:hypothetical protein